MIHRSGLPHYQDDWKKLAEELGDLRYDALADFLSALSDKIALDAGEDEARGRHKLASKLHESAAQLSGAGNAIAKAWEICAPFMKKD